jgi:hypothetical protein
MPIANTYSLSAYDAKTGERLFHWPTVVETELKRPTAGVTVIDTDGQHWLVIGVRQGSTFGDWRIDVEKS